MYIESSSELNKVLPNALKGWNKLLGAGRLHSLLVSQKYRQDGKSPNRVLKSMLNEFLTELSRIDESAADLLRLRFYEEATIKEVAYEWKASIDQINRQQKKAIDLLCGLIWAKEQELRSAVRLEYMLSSPIPPRVLIGREVQIDLLIRYIVTKFNVVAITGLGGVGKSAIALELGWRLLAGREFDKVIWLGSSKGNGHNGLMQFVELGDPRSVLGADKRLLNQNVLYILDGAQLTNAMWRNLGRLGLMIEPSKILVTCRTRPLGTRDVYFHSLPELSMSDSIVLLAHLMGVTIASLGSSAGKIYESVGGNPGAIRYIANQLKVFPLDVILARINKVISAVMGDVEMDKNTAEVVRVVTNHEAIAYPDLSKTTDLKAEEVEEGVKEALRLSLLNFSGSIETRTYSIPQIAKTYQNLYAP